MDGSQGFDLYPVDKETLLGGLKQASEQLGVNLKTFMRLLCVEPIRSLSRLWGDQQKDRSGPRGTGWGSGTRQRERIVNTSGKETKAETTAGQVGVMVSSL